MIAFMMHHAAFAGLSLSALSAALLAGLARRMSESRIAVRKAGCCSRKADTCPPGTHLT